jgi:hypothetical protein
VQVKWGEEILLNFIEQVQDQDAYEHLNQVINMEMERINLKHQHFK